MALKDWKKIGNYWRKNNGYRLYIYIGEYPTLRLRKYRVYIVDNSGTRFVKLQNVSKSQALKFAKSYMRTH